MDMKMKKPSQGRQKIAIAKIAKKSNLQVTFSKRRSGVFKKASELCTLCGVEVAIIVFSPANKPFSFGHLEVDSILDRFLVQNPNTNPNPLDLAGSTTSTTRQQLVEARRHRNASVHELNLQLTEFVNQFEAERKCGDQALIDKASEKQCWWERPVEELALNELEILKASMEELNKNVTKQVNTILLESSSAAAHYSSSSSPSPFFFLNNGIVQRDDCNPFEIKKHAADQIIGPAYNFGYAGHGIL